MPWWVTALGVTGPLLWAVYLLWRVEVWKRRRDEQSGRAIRAENSLSREQEITAELRVQLGNKDTAMSILRSELTRIEEDYYALAAKTPGAIRDRLRAQLRAGEGAGKSGSSD